MDVDTQSVNLTLSVEETKHFLATSMILPITLKRSEPTIKLATTELKVVGGKPTGSINITSYDGDGELTATSSDTEYATVKVANSSGVTVTYLKGDKDITVMVGCNAGKFYRASEGVACTISCLRSDPTLTLNGYVATVYGGGSSSVVNITYSGLEGSTTNLMPIKVASDDESVATVILTNNCAIISYAGAGTTNVRIYTEMGNYYNAASAVVSVTCAKTTVTIPSLSGTSFATTGSNVGPTVKNYNSNLMTQSGTASTNVLGTYTITWTLKDTTKYCWTDGTTAVKTASWTCTGGTITIYWDYCNKAKDADRAVKLAFKNKWTDYIKSGYTYATLASYTTTSGDDEDTYMLRVRYDNKLFMCVTSTASFNGYITAYQDTEAGTGPKNGGVYYNKQYVSNAF
jgi:hypothetical protein